MDIDIILEPDLTPDQITELGQAAEKYGIRALWTSNYFAHWDPFISLVPLAQASEPGAPWMGLVRRDKSRQAMCWASRSGGGRMCNEDLRIFHPVLPGTLGGRRGSPLSWEGAASVGVAAEDERVDCGADAG